MRILYATTCALALSAASAQAQVLTIATSNPGGLTHSIGSAVARTLTDSAGIRTVVVPAGGSPMPPVAGGDAECGINVAYDLSYYVGGTNYYVAEGAHGNLRLVGPMLPSLITMYVRTDSDIAGIDDLRGRRIPGGLSAQLAIGEVYETVLRFAGLTRDDVQTIPAQSIVQAADDFTTGRNDAFMFSIGAAKVLEVHSSVGGLRALSMPDTEESRAIMDQYLPGAYLVALEPGPEAQQIVGPTNVIAYDLVLFCADTVPEETVYRITQAIHGNRDMLVESFAAMSRFAPERMATEVPGVTRHPGAQRFYEEIGLLPAQN